MERLKVGYKRESFSCVFSLNTTLLEGATIQVLSRLTKLQEYGCCICPVTKKILKTMRTANIQFTSLQVWMKNKERDDSDDEEKRDKIANLEQIDNLLEGSHQIQHLQVITIDQNRPDYGDDEGYETLLHDSVNKLLQYPRQNMVHIDLRSGDERCFTLTQFLNILDTVRCSSPFLLSVFLFIGSLKKKIELQHF